MLKSSLLFQVVLFGNFVILNLFLAILMSSFDEQRSKLHEAMESKRELSRVGCPECAESDEIGRRKGFLRKMKSDRKRSWSNRIQRLKRESSL